MKQLDSDHDQRLFGRFALGLLAEIDGAPLATAAHGSDGGQVERPARKARAHARQAGRRRAVAARADDRVKAHVRDERPRIGEAGERTKFAEQGGGRLRADARDGLQQLGVGGPRAGFAGGRSVVAAWSTSSMALLRRSSWLTSVRTTCARAAAALPR